ncbi:hypothetical protein [Bacillus sp. WP8]|nr:hypothetical protein [Bacillus sp. WP8]
MRENEEEYEGMEVNRYGLGGEEGVLKMEGMGEGEMDFFWIVGDKIKK